MSTSRFIVQTSKACMPSSCWGRYINVAVIETDGRERVAMISPRARGVRRIVSYEGKLHDGKTSRSASGRALAKARALAAELNNAAEPRFSTVTVLP